MRMLGWIALNCLPSLTQRLLPTFLPLSRVCSNERASHRVPCCWEQRISPLVSWTGLFLIGPSMPSAADELGPGNTAISRSTLAMHPPFSRTWTNLIKKHESC